MQIKKVIGFINEYCKHIRQSRIYSKEKIDSQKIILWSFRGKTYSCNPKYITEYIINQGLTEKYKLVWAFNEPEEYKWLRELGITTVRYYSDEFFRELMTSHFVITNTRFGIDFHKRIGQIYIQTWHGTLALKSIERDAKDSLNKVYLLNAINDSKKIDYLVSGSKKSTEIFRKSFWYNGKILNCGNPRNDIFFQVEKCKMIISKKYGFSEKKIILYAPTFRNHKRTDVYNLDCSALIEVMEERFKEQYVVLCRLHPNLKGSRIIESDKPNIIDATDYDDMQELLSACDVLITDFSSSMFDMCIMRKMCFLYASDFSEYIKNERELYFDVEKDLPFPLAKENEELRNLILSFDSSSYFARLDKFTSELGMTEDGRACERILNIFDSYCR